MRAYVFDFDGLLVDTETPEYDAWRQLFEEHCAQLPHEVWASNVGLATPAVDLESLLREQATNPPSRQAIREWSGRLGRQILETAEVRDGVEGVLDHLRTLGAKLGVASSASHKWVDHHLHRTGLADYFSCVVCIEDAPRSKPAPDLYLEALRRLSHHPHEATAFEDSPHGVSAAKAAGMRCVAVTNPVTRSLDFSHADLVLHCWHEFMVPAS